MLSKLGSGAFDGQYHLVERIEVITEKSDSSHCSDNDDDDDDESSVNLDSSTSVVE